MDSFLRLFRENTAALYIIATVFFVLGYLFAFVATTRAGNGMQDLKLSMHLIGDRIEIFNKDGGRIQRRYSSQDVKIPGDFYARHSIDIIVNKVNPYYYYVNIDGVRYCFLLNSNWQVVGRC